MEYILAIIVLLLCAIYTSLIVMSEEKDKKTVSFLFVANLLVVAAIYYTNYNFHQAEIKDWQGLLKL